eukprot:CAMPEP_0114656076 /NCGR_PEP_ID=MMETSP0191-20121206/11802_1 /TAXON_ID=126664 /ORGANISM="Sorites sp." /LENGTH=40 /DNA_ID= /DNA_START= /DNA_END= /DNA_ORIENTATION=
MEMHGIVVVEEIIHEDEDEDEDVIEDVDADLIEDIKFIVI